MNNQTKINCPTCNTEIDVNSILYNQLQSELQTKFNADLKEEKNKIEKQGQDLKIEKEEFEKKKLNENELFQARVKSALKDEAIFLEKSIKAKIEEEKSEEVSALQKELNEKSEQVKELNKSRAEIAKLKREKDEAKSFLSETGSTSVKAENSILEPRVAFAANAATADESRPPLNSIPTFSSQCILLFAAVVKSARRPTMAFVTFAACVFLFIFNFQ